MVIRKLSPDVQSALRTGITITDSLQCVIELVQNSLDAGSNSIAVRVDLENMVIQVVDNGCGISQDDLNLIGNRYVTNKCHTLKDFKTKLKFYGFRGESLASLRESCGVLMIISKLMGNNETFSKVFRGSKASQVTLAVHNRLCSGTTVVVKDFLNNLPVRRSRVQPAVELEDIRHALIYLSIINYKVSFTLRNDVTKVVILQTNDYSDEGEALKHHCKTTQDHSLIPITVHKHPFKIVSKISRQTEKNYRFQMIFVNKRLIKNKTLYKLINKELAKSFYLRHTENKDRLNKDKLYSVYLVNISCPYFEYDISSDPKKLYVEFRNWDIVTECLKSTVSEFLLTESDLNKMNPTTVLDTEFHAQQTIKSNCEPKYNIFHPTMVGQDLYQEKNVHRTKHFETEKEQQPHKNKDSTEDISQLKSNINECKTKEKNVDSLETNLRTSLHENMVEKQSDSFKVQVSASEANSNLDEEKILTGFQMEHSLQSNSNNTILFKVPHKRPLKRKNCSEHLLSEYESDISPSKSRFSSLISLTKKNESEFSNSILPTISVEFLNENLQTLTSARNDMFQYPRNGRNVTPNQNFQIDVYKTIKRVRKSNDIKVIQKQQIKILDLNKGCYLDCSKNCHSSIKLKKIFSDSSANINKINMTQAKYETSSYSLINHQQNEPLEVQYENVEPFIEPVTKRKKLKQSLTNFKGLKRYNALETVSTYTKPKDISASGKNENAHKIHLEMENRTNKVFESAQNFQDSPNHYPVNNTLYAPVKSMGFYPANDINGDVWQCKTNSFMKTFNNGFNNNINPSTHLLTDFGNKDILEPLEEHCTVNRSDGCIISSVDLKSVEEDFRFGNCDSVVTSLCHQLQTLSLQSKPVYSKHFPCFSKSKFIHATDFDKKYEGQLKLSPILDSYSFKPIYSMVCDKIRTIQNNDLFNSNHHFTNDGHNNPTDQKFNLKSKVNTTMLKLNTKALESINIVNNDQDKVYFPTLNDTYAHISSNKTTQSNYFNFCKLPLKEAQQLENKPPLTKDCVGENCTITKTCIEIQDLSTQDKAIDATNIQWNKENTPNGHTIFINTITGMSAFDKPESLNENLTVPFQLQNRHWFMPRGISPLVEMTTNDEENMKKLTTSEKAKIENILQLKLSEDLSTVKWKTMPYNDDFLQDMNEIHFCYKLNHNFSFEKGCVFSKESLGMAKVLGQVDCKFIAACMRPNEEDNEFLILFDQHAVDERIRVENLLSEYKEPDGKLLSVSINPHLNLSLSNHETALLTSILPKTLKLGLKINIGETNVSVAGVPLCLFNKAAKEKKGEIMTEMVTILVKQILFYAEEMRGLIPNLLPLLQDIINTEACRGAVKFGDSLSLEICQSLISKLALCDTPFQCAHGRPVLTPLMEIQQPHIDEVRINFSRLTNQGDYDEIHNME